MAIFSISFSARFSFGCMAECECVFVWVWVCECSERVIFTTIAAEFQTQVNIHIHIHTYTHKKRKAKKGSREGEKGTQRERKTTRSHLLLCPCGLLHLWLWVVANFGTTSCTPQRGPPGPTPRVSSSTSPLVHCRQLSNHFTCPIYCYFFLTKRAPEAEPALMATPKLTRRQPQVFPNQVLTTM